MLYQVYFRTSRGGTGIPFELAKTEFFSVFGKHDSKATREWWAKHRMWVELNLTPDQIAVKAADLGYTEAILEIRYEPYRGEELSRIDRGRWFIGDGREQDTKVHQSEVYVQDAASLVADAPSNRTFEIREAGQNRLAVGHRSHRALSTLDARCLLNVAAVDPTETILDPFAGYGGIVREAKRRDLRISASDIDRLVSPGLLAQNPEIYSVADARHLPYPTGHFDLIVTEPPFRTAYRQAVNDSLPELHRVIKPDGRMILLIEKDMLDQIQDALCKIGYRVENLGIIPRGGGMRCPLLLVSR